jgi:hypothetical protein
MRPTIIEMPYDHAGPKGVVHQGFCDGDTGVVSRRSPAQASMKRQMFLAYASQCSALAKFDPEIERFGIVGGAMFKTLPNNGMLLRPPRRTRGRDLKANACGLPQVSAGKRNDRGIERNDRRPEHACARSIPRAHVGHEHVKWILVAGRCNTLAMHFRSSSLACSCYFVTIWRAGSPTSNGTIDAICCHGALPDRRQGGSDWGRV